MADDFPEFVWRSARGQTFNFSNPPLVDVIDYTNIGLPNTTLEIAHAPLSGGSITHARLNAQQIVLVLSLTGSSFAQNNATLDAIREATMPLGPDGPQVGTLVVTRQTTNRVTEMPAILAGGVSQSGEWYEAPTNWKIPIAFQALEPTWRSPQYDVGIPTTPFGHYAGLSFPATWPIQFAPSTLGLTHKVLNMGDAISKDVEFLFTVGSSGLTNPSVTHEESGRFIKITRTIPSGATLTFTNRTSESPTAYSGIVNLEEHLDTSSRGLPLWTGINTFRIDSDQGEGTTVFMRYVARYNGA